MTSPVQMLALAATVVVATAVLTLRFLGEGPEPGETADDPTTVVVAGHPLTLPKNVVRFAAQRRPGAQARLDLALSWPELAGRTVATAARFDTPGLAADIVYLTIAPAGDGLDSAARLATVYARFFTGEPIGGPAGLEGHRMAMKSGYEDEIVWTEPGAVHPFVARCYPLTPGEAPSVCLHDLRIGAISVEWRFPAALLGERVALEAGLEQRLSEWGLPRPR